MGKRKAPNGWERERDATFAHQASTKGARAGRKSTKGKFPCPDCPKVFKFQANLSNHMLKAHKADGAPAPAG